MLVLCLYYVCIMLVLCLYYVCIMFVLCLYYACISQNVEFSACYPKPK